MVYCKDDEHEWMIVDIELVKSPQKEWECHWKLSSLMKMVCLKCFSLGTRIMDGKWTFEMIEKARREKRRT